MREGWEIKTIGEVCEIYNGGTPSTNIPEYWDGGIQWITPKDMGKSKEMYVSHCERTITQEGVEHSSAKVLPERSVIVSSRAPIGYVAINEVPMATNQGCKGFVLGKEIYPEFLYYFLLSSTELLNKLGTGATFKEVSGKKLAGIELPLPSLPEQQRIVDILDREFAKIDALKANAEKSLQAAKDLFQATLKKELEPKEGWAIKTLSGIVDEGSHISYGIVQPGDDFPGGIPVVRPVDLTMPVLRSTSTFKRTRPEISQAYRRSILAGKEILLCVRGTTGVLSLSSVALRGCNTTRGIVPLSFADDTERQFVYYALLSPACQKYIAEYTNGTALKQINIADVKNIPVPVAPKKEQEKVVSFLDVLTQSSNSLQENYQKTLTLCDDLKQALLRRAFNGEL